MPTKAPLNKACTTRRLIHFAASKLTCNNENMARAHAGGEGGVIRAAGRWVGGRLHRTGTYTNGSLSHNHTLNNKLFKAYWLNKRRGTINAMVSIPIFIRGFIRRFSRQRDVSTLLVVSLISTRAAADPREISATHEACRCRRLC